MSDQIEAEVETEYIEAEVETTDIVVETRPKKEK